MLSSRYKQLFHSDLREQTRNLCASEELKNALTIVLQIARPSPTVLVDQSQVHEDVQEIRKLCKRTFPPRLSLLNIFLNRSDSHIAQIAALYKKQKNKDLDEAIQKLTEFSRREKQLVLHALRTATNITSRDALLLRDTMRTANDENSLKLGIRLTRMHWFTQHWIQVKSEYQKITKKQFSQGKRIGEAEFNQLIAVLIK